MSYMYLLSFENSIALVLVSCFMPSYVYCAFPLFIHLFFYVQASPNYVRQVYNGSDVSCLLWFCLLVWQVASVFTHNVNTRHVRVSNRYLDITNRTLTHGEITVQIIGHTTEYTGPRQRNGTSRVCIRCMVLKMQLLLIHAFQKFVSAWGFETQNYTFFILNSLIELAFVSRIMHMHTVH